jgi:hypothetical protein
MIHALQAIPPSSSVLGQSVGATGLLGLSSGIEWLLTIFAVVSLALSAALFFWVSAGHKHLEQSLTQKLTDSAATNARLRQENADLTATNRELRQTIAELSAGLKEVQEKTAGAASS